MSYWTRQEIDFFKHLGYLEHKKVKLRKKQYCYNSGDLIEPGETAEAVKVYPSSTDGKLIGLSVPSIFYKCGHCGDCTH